MCYIASAQQIAYNSQNKATLNKQGFSQLHDLEPIVPKQFSPLIKSLGDTETQKGNLRLVDPSNVVQQFLASAVYMIQHLPLNIR